MLYFCSPFPPINLDQNESPVAQVLLQSLNQGSKVTADGSQEEVQLKPCAG